MSKDELRVSGPLKEGLMKYLHKRNMVADDGRQEDDTELPPTSRIAS